MLEIIKQTLQGVSGKYSEKRATKLVVVLVMLSLTVFDTVKNGELNEAVFMAWMAFLSHEGYRMTAEKKIKNEE